jgi:hypothetical protein
MVLAFKYTGGVGLGKVILQCLAFCGLACIKWIAFKGAELVFLIWVHLEVGFTWTQ